MHRGSRRARSTGSTLLIVVMLGMITTGASLALGLQLLACNLNRQMTQTDSMCLAMAKSLNFNDRQGKINNFISWSREEVYTSRQTLQNSEASHQELSQLAQLLVDDARSGAVRAEQVRLQLLNQTKQELVEILSNARTGSAESTTVPISQKIKLGYVGESISNVRASSPVQSLFAHDVAQGFVEPNGGLLRGNIDARLPGPDNDLPFKLSALERPQINTTLQAALVLHGDVKQTAEMDASGQIVSGALEHLPSAVDIVIETVNENDKLKTFTVARAARASGAMPQPSL